MAGDVVFGVIRAGVENGRLIWGEGCRTAPLSPSRRGRSPRHPPLRDGSSAGVPPCDEPSPDVGESCIVPFGSAVLPTLLPSVRGSSRPPDVGAVGWGLLVSGLASCLDDVRESL